MFPAVGVQNFFFVYPLGKRVHFLLFKYSVPHSTIHKYTSSRLYAHLHRNGRVRFIPHHFEITVHKLFNIADPFPFPFQLRERLWLPLQLFFESIHMITIYVSVSQLDDEVMRVGARDMRNHMRE